MTIFFLLGDLFVLRWTWFNTKTSDWLYFYFLPNLWHLLCSQNLLHCNLYVICLRNTRLTSNYFVIYDIYLISELLKCYLTFEALLDFWTVYKCFVFSMMLIVVYDSCHYIYNAHELRYLLDLRIFKAFTFVRSVVFWSLKFQIVYFVSDVLIKLGAIFIWNIKH